MTDKSQTTAIARIIRTILESLSIYSSSRTAIMKYQKWFKELHNEH
jgi:hypothetical protein